MSDPLFAYCILTAVVAGKRTHSGEEQSKEQSILKFSVHFAQSCNNGGIEPRARLKLSTCRNVHASFFPSFSCVYLHPHLYTFLV